MYDNSPTMHPSKMDGPTLQYVFKNYGKSPGVLQSAMHGIHIDSNPSDTMRTFVMSDSSLALEIIGVGAESAVSTVSYTEPFTFGDARALVTEDAALYFYGEAIYTDTFGAEITLQWEFLADGGKLRQTKHYEKRQNPSGAQ